MCFFLQFWQIPNPAAIPNCFVQLVLSNIVGAVFIWFTELRAGRATVSNEISEGLPK